MELFSSLLKKQFCLPMIAVFLTIGIAAPLMAQEDVSTLEVPIDEGFRDMNLEAEEYQQGPPNKANTAVIIECEWIDGKILRKGDKGYDKCIARASMPQARSTKPAKSNKKPVGTKAIGN